VRLSAYLARRPMKEWDDTAMRLLRTSGSTDVATNKSSRHVTDGSKILMGLEPFVSDHALVRNSIASVTMSHAHGLGWSAARSHLRIGER